MALTPEEAKSSFIADLSPAGSRGNFGFSYVVHRYAQYAGIGTHDTYGYEQKYHEYLTGSSFEDIRLRLYFRYEGNGQYYAHIESPAPDKLLCISNNGYLYASDFDSSWHKRMQFNVFQEDKETLINLEETPDTSHVYLKALRTDTFIKNYEINSAGDHVWSYITDEGEAADAIKFKLDIKRRNVSK